MTAAIARIKQPLTMASVHAELDACRACPKMVGPVVHGPDVTTPIFLLGQAPGPREGGFGRPFAWTAGRTLFRWLAEATGASEDVVRQKVYFAAVARCFPGKASGGGDRRPATDEIERCKPFIAAEIAVLKPKLVLPVGTLAIEQVMGKATKLDAIVGMLRQVRYHGADVDVIALPHPSGASPWHKLEPGKTMLLQALTLVANHETVREVFGR